MNSLTMKHYLDNPKEVNVKFNTRMLDMTVSNFLRSIIPNPIYVEALDCVNGEASVVYHIPVVLAKNQMVEEILHFLRSAFDLPFLVSGKAAQVGAFKRTGYSTELSEDAQTVQVYVNFEYTIID